VGTLIFLDGLKILKNVSRIVQFFFVLVSDWSKVAQNREKKDSACHVENQISHLTS
jgi:hypothetical protein